MKSSDLRKDYILAFFGGIFGGLATVSLTDFKNSGFCSPLSFKLLECVYSAGINVILLVIFFFLGWFAVNHVLIKNKIKKRM